MKRWILLLLTIFPAAGCVSTKTFKAQQERADALAVELDTAKSERTSQAEQARAQLDDAQARLQAAMEQLASVQKSNADLQGSLEAKKGELTTKIAELIREKDALAQRLSEAASETAELGRRLAAAEQEKTALEAAKEAELAKVTQSYEDITGTLKSEIAAGEITITRLKGRLTLNLVDRILFDSGSAEVKSAGQKVLDRVGGALNNVQGKDIRIEGHSDNKPIAAELRARYPTNWELSAARATAVARYLQDHAKVDPKRLTAAGYAEFRPVAGNDSPEGRALNRRIEVILAPKD